jgi:hypothetical protein
MTTTNLLVAITNGERGDRTRIISVHIEDEATADMLVTADMTGPQFVEFVTGGSVDTGTHSLQLSVFLHSDDKRVKVIVYNADHKRICDFELTGEQFAAILGNKVTGVAAQVYGRQS